MDEILNYATKFQLKHAPKLYRLLTVSILIPLLSGGAASGGASGNVKKIGDPIRDIICNLLCVFVDVAGALAALVFVAAAVQWIASRDDPAKRKQAKTIMVHAIIGMVAVGIARNIMDGVKQSEMMGTCSKCGT